MFVLLTAEVGDYDPEDHPPGYVAEFKMLPKQNAKMEEKIAELHQTLVYVILTNLTVCTFMNCSCSHKLMWLLYMYIYMYLIYTVKLLNCFSQLSLKK